MYRAKELFIDLQDNGHRYEVGDEFPRLGLKPSLARISELASTSNRRGIVLIEEVADLVNDEEPKTEAPEKKSTKKASSSKKASKK